MLRRQQPDYDMGPIPWEAEAKEHPKWKDNWQLQSNLQELLGLVRPCHSSGSHWILTAANWVQSQVRSCGIFGGQSGTGAGFLQVLWIPLPICIPSTAPHSSPCIIQGWYNEPNSDRRTKRTQSHTTPRNFKKITTGLSGTPKWSEMACWSTTGGQLKDDPRQPKQVAWAGWMKYRKSSTEEADNWVSTKRWTWSDSSTIRYKRGLHWEVAPAMWHMHYNTKLPNPEPGPDKSL
jgi:hypothetical protein